MSRQLVLVCGGAWILCLCLLIAAWLAGCAEVDDDDEVTHAPEATHGQALTAPGALPDRYVVVFAPGVQSAQAAHALARHHGARVDHLYAHALQGMAIRASPQAAEALSRSPRVARVEPDQLVLADSQTQPTGVRRILAPQSAVAAIDGVDTRVDVDVAVIDSGIDLDHPDLDVVSAVDLTFTNGTGDDDAGHGTHVAGTVGALDNGLGVVGVAPGARLHAIKVLRADGNGSVSSVIAGLDVVAAQASTIEVANLSLGLTGCSQSLHEAVAAVVEAGVVVTASAGNSGVDQYGRDGAADFDTARVCRRAWPVHKNSHDDHIPSAYPEVMAISALVDTDGNPGGNGSATYVGADDSFASFSNFGSTVVSWNPVAAPGRSIDLLMPGTYIVSTCRNGVVCSMSGTSMAAPHAAGLAALFIAEHGRAHDAAGVAAIRQALIDAADPQHTNRGLRVLNDPDDAWEPLGQAATLPPPSAEPPPPPAGDTLTVTGLAPSTLTAGTHGTFVLTGTGLDASVQVTLEGGSGPAPSVVSVTGVDSTRLDLELSAGNGGPPRARSWDVRVGRDGQSAVCAGCLVVVP